MVYVYQVVRMTLLFGGALLFCGPLASDSPMPRFYFDRPTPFPDIPEGPQIRISFPANYLEWVIEYERLKSFGIPGFPPAGFPPNGYTGIALHINKPIDLHVLEGRVIVRDKYFHPRGVSEPERSLISWPYAKAVLYNDKPICVRDIGSIRIWLEREAHLGVDVTIYFDRKKLAASGLKTLDAGREVQRFVDTCDDGWDHPPFYVMSCENLNKVEIGKLKDEPVLLEDCAVIRVHFRPLPKQLKDRLREEQKGRRTGPSTLTVLSD